MGTTTWKVATAFALTLAVVAPLEAQGRGNRDRDRDDDRYEELYERGERKRERDRDDVYRRAERQGDRNDRYERARRHERGNGPSFCRSGSGHPVFGWEWCRDRGWDRSDRRYPVRWERRTWEDVVFRRTDRRDRLDRRDLGDILGSVIFGRLDTRRRELGSRDLYTGRWMNTSSGRELWVTAGGIPLARLIDRDGDRRVDAVYLAER